MGARLVILVGAWLGLSIHLLATPSTRADLAWRIKSLIVKHALPVDAEEDGKDDKP
ncbi:MAG TPA: hypothetical protein VLJ62_09635 [Burkholderiaceae bacterium]|nr:hypothetical protein [Burkholderiaceae bacterium]